MSTLAKLACHLAGKTMLLVVAGGVLSAARAASATTINFDGVADGTVINSAYTGLTFSNPLGGDVLARSTILAESPDNVVSIFSTGIPAFHAGYGAVDVAFGTAQQTVSINAAPGAPFEFLTPLTKLPYLQAFDASNNVLATVYYSGALPDESAEVGPYETLTISRATADIAKVRFSVQNPLTGPATWGLFDNLTYGPAPVVPLPAAVWGGLVLLGGMGLTKGLRRRKRAGSEAA